MTETPYTDADVQLVREAIRTTPPCPEWLATEPALAGMPCEKCESRNVLAALAAAGRLAPVDDDPRHIIEFRTDGWTIKHPLACRPNLFDCPVNRAAERGMAGLDGPPAPPGRYVCALGSPEEPGDWFFIGDRVDSVEG